MKTSYIIIIVVVLTALLVASVTHPMWNNSELISPLARVFQMKTVPSPVPSPSPRIKTFNFNASTDLKQELDSVNPQVLDSDFGVTSNE